MRITVNSIVPPARIFTWEEMKDSPTGTLFKEYNYPEYSTRYLIVGAKDSDRRKVLYISGQTLDICIELLHMQKKFVLTNDTLTITQT